MKAKILIVGGGVMGTSIALRVAKRSDPVDQPVVLIERDEIGAGSTGRSGGILRQLYADRILAAMARDSLREYAAFEPRTGRSIGFRRTGVLTLAGPRQREWIGRIRELCAELSDIGIRLELVDEDGIRARFPGIRVTRETIGVWERDAGSVEPLQTVQAFAALARIHGAVTRLGIEVTGIRIEDGRVSGVETTGEGYETEKVVVVAGPWSAGLLRKSGVDLPLRILRPENHFLALPHAEVVEEHEPVNPGLGFDISDEIDRLSETSEWSASLDVQGMHPTLIDLENGFYCRCDPANRRTRVGHTDYDSAVRLQSPEEFEEEVTEETKAWAREALSMRIPEYREQPDAGSQAGMYSLTPDAQPIMGPIPGIEGLFVVTGFSGHGFKLAPSVGEGMAQMLLGESVSAFDAEFFSPARFRGDEEWSGKFGL